MNKIIRFTVVASMIALLAGCSTWNGMSSREKKMVGGAAVGGLVGDQLGK